MDPGRDIAIQAYMEELEKVSEICDTVAYALQKVAREDPGTGGGVAGQPQRPSPMDQRVAAYRQKRQAAMTPQERGAQATYDRQTARGMTFRPTPDMPHAQRGVMDRILARQGSDVAPGSGRTMSYGKVNPKLVYAKPGPLLSLMSPAGGGAALARGGAALARGGAAAWRGAKAGAQVGVGGLVRAAIPQFVRRPGFTREAGKAIGGKMRAVRGGQAVAKPTGRQLPSDLYREALQSVAKHQPAPPVVPPTLFQRAAGIGPRPALPPRVPGATKWQQAKRTGRGVVRVGEGFAGTVGDAARVGAVGMGVKGAREAGRLGSLGSTGVKKGPEGKVVPTAAAQSAIERIQKAGRK